jgi:hypothetical protein
VDNGPDGFVQKENDRLYGPAGLAAAHAALRPGGILTVWSADPDGSFTRALLEAGFDVEVALVPAYEGRARSSTACGLPGAIDRKRNFVLRGPA